MDELEKVKDTIRKQLNKMVQENEEREKISNIALGVLSVPCIITLILTIANVSFPPGVFYLVLSLISELCITKTLCDYKKKAYDYCNDKLDDDSENIEKKDANKFQFETNKNELKKILKKEKIGRIFIALTIVLSVICATIGLPFPEGYLFFPLAIGGLLISLNYENKYNLMRDIIRDGNHLKLREAYEIDKEKNKSIVKVEEADNSKTEGKEYTPEQKALVERLVSALSRVGEDKSGKGQFVKK